MDNNQFLYLLNGENEVDPGPVPEGMDFRTHQITQRILRKVREACTPFINEPRSMESDRRMLDIVGNKVNEFYFNGEIVDRSYYVECKEDGSRVGRITFVPPATMNKVYINIDLN